jgi:hypothetical protein
VAYDVEFQRGPSWLRVRLSGESRDLESTLEAWQRIAGEVARERPAALLVISEVRGAPLQLPQVEAFVRGMRGLGLEMLRVAYVYPRLEGWLQVETAQILAMEAGFEVRAFADERAAEVWLRHGER